LLGGTVERAYRRRDALEKRRELMQAWGPDASQGRVDCGLAMIRIAITVAAFAAIAATMPLGSATRRSALAKGERLIWLERYSGDTTIEIAGVLTLLS
jgi:hypothetical protein